MILVIAMMGENAVLRIFRIYSGYDCINFRGSSLRIWEELKAPLPPGLFDRKRSGNAMARVVWLVMFRR